MLPDELRERLRFGVPIEAEEPKFISSATPTTATAAPVAGTNPVGAAKQLVEKLKKDLFYLDEEFKKAEAESAAATTPTKRFYSKNRLDALTVQMAELNTKIGDAELSLKKLEAGQ